VPAPATPAPQPVGQAQLDQLTAPVALYPDPLLGDVLMASTYPLEIVEAARWVRVPANKALSGDALADALKAQNWDPSVMALVPFPQVLAQMADQLQWTEQLGNAFLAQQGDVMEAVQRLRHEAMTAGTLKATPECHCLIQTGNDIVSILPADPKIVCLPIYNPRVAFGTWSEPAYPPIVFQPPPGFAYEPGLWIGFAPPIELAVFGPLWGWDSFDWSGGRILVDNGLYSRVDPRGGSLAGGTWVHNPAHRGGVAYADPAVQARFGAAARTSVTASGRFGAAATAGRLGAGAAVAGSRPVPIRGTGFAGRAVASRGVGRFGAAAAHAAPSGFHGGFAHAAGPQIARGHASRAHFSGGVPHGGIARAPGGGGPHGGGPHGGGGGHHR
jgi:hypothetical protein